MVLCLGLLAKYKSVSFYTAAKMRGWTYVRTDVCKHSKRTDSKLLLLEISKRRNCSSVGCLKCVQFHNWFRSIKKKKLTRLLPSEKRGYYMQRFKIKAVLGVLRKNFPFRNE